MVDDEELARRSVLGYGETLVAFGRGSGTPIVRPGVLGAQLPQAAGSPWLDAAVVVAGAAPPSQDDPGLPHCLWSTAEAVAGREEDETISMPCLGIELGRLPREPVADDVVDVVVPSFPDLGALNELAYDDHGVLGPVIGALHDPRARAHGLRVDGQLAAVTMTLRVGDDVSLQYVATAPAHQRRGLASALLRAVLAEAWEGGAQTATLQASPDGLPVYERLGFRRVALLRAHRRPPGTG